VLGLRLLSFYQAYSSLLHTCHWLVSCYRRWVNKLSKMKVHQWTYNHCLFISYFTSVAFGYRWISDTKFQKFSDQDWIWIFKKFIEYGSGVKKSISAHLCCTEVDLRFAFHWGARGHNTDLLTHHHDPTRYLHIVIVAVGHILLLWVFSRWSDLSYLNANPMQKYTAQYIAYPNSCHCH